MAFENDTQEALDALEDHQLCAICAGFGADKRARTTALAFLATQDEADVKAGIRMVSAVASAQAAHAPKAEEAPKAPQEPTCTMVLEEDFELTYNRFYEFPAGKDCVVPLSVGLYVVQQCRTRGIMHKLTPND